MPYCIEYNVSLVYSITNSLKLLVRNVYVCKYNLGGLINAQLPIPIAILYIDVLC